MYLPSHPTPKFFKLRPSMKAGSLCDFRQITPLGFSVLCETDTVTMDMGTYTEQCVFFLTSCG